MKDGWQSRTTSVTCAAKGSASPMFLAYMDESGNTGRKADPSQPIHMLGCLIVKDTSVRPMEDAISEVATKHFPTLIGKDGFEFHGAEMYSGKGLFKGTSPETRIAALGDLFDVCSEHAEAFGYTGVDKQKSYANDHPHRIAFTLMIERLDPWLKGRSDLGLIVADENNEVGQSLITDMEWFKQHSTSWGYVHVNVTNIIDSVHFVKSHNNRLIQACDAMTFITLKAIMLGQKKFEEFCADTAKDRPSYPTWLKKNTTRSEAATFELNNAVGKLTLFRAKIWPT
jgi:hypothetical protein